MTREEIDRVRLMGAIKIEAQIIAAIPSHSFVSATAPHIMGLKIRDECVQRITGLIEGTVTP